MECDKRFPKKIIPLSLSGIFEPFSLLKWQIFSLNGRTLEVSDICFVVIEQNKLFITEFIALDGKTSRRSFDRTKGRSAVHTVSAWLSDAGLVWGQYKTAAKSNEITAIPRLLRIIDIRVQPSQLMQWDARLTSRKTLLSKAVTTSLR